MVVSHPIGNCGDHSKINQLNLLSSYSNLTKKPIELCCDFPTLEPAMEYWHTQGTVAH